MSKGVDSTTLSDYCPCLAASAWWQRGLRRRTLTPYLMDVVALGGASLNQIRIPPNHRWGLRPFFDPLPCHPLPQRMPSPPPRAPGAKSHSPAPFAPPSSPADVPLDPPKYNGRPQDKQQFFQSGWKSLQGTLIPKGLVAKSSSKPVLYSLTAVGRSTTDALSQAAPAQELRAGAGAAVESAAPDLPAGWELLKTPDGQPYYYHRSTQRAQWQLPDVAADAAPPAARAVQSQQEMQQPRRRHSASQPRSAGIHAHATRTSEPAVPSVTSSRSRGTSSSQPRCREASEPPPEIHRPRPSVPDVSPSPSSNAVAVTSPSPPPSPAHSLAGGGWLMAPVYFARGTPDTTPAVQQSPIETIEISDATPTPRARRRSRRSESPPPPKVVMSGRLLCARPASGHPGAQKPPLGRGPPPPIWGCPLGHTWPTATAVALLRVDTTRGSETGKVWGLRWHNLPRERKGK